MQLLENVYNWAYPGLPNIVGIVLALILLYAVRAILNKRFKGKLEFRFRRQIATMILTLIALFVVILLLPVSETSRGQLLSLLGILLSAAIALSSTTLLGNLMAGMMLRAIRNFRAGDFVEVGEHFGRVSDRGLFHIEIQTEDRDLTTLPNLYLVTHPVSVSRSSGTIITATVSLGYDVPRRRVEELLLEAAAMAELQEPFVQVVDLGDYSVTYRVAGLLTEVKQIISARSKLRQMMLDSLHDGGVEIVSPTFMNTRALERGQVFIPVNDKTTKIKEPSYTSAPEDVVFDKAEKAESIERLKEMYDEMSDKINALKDQIESAALDKDRDALKSERSRLKERRERLAEIIKKREEEKKK